MKNFVQEGEKMTWTNGTGSAVASGDVVVVGSTIGVACGDIADGATGVLALEGVFTVPKASGSSGHAIAQGDVMLYDVSAKKFDIKTATPAAGDILGGAAAHEAAVTTATTVSVRLFCGVGAIQAGS